MTLHLGILLALLCAVASNVAFFYKHRGACEACAVDIKHPFRTAKSLWSSKWFAAGLTTTPRQWWGLALMALGLILLGITLPASEGSHSAFSEPAMIAFQGGLLGVGALLIMGPRLGGPAEHHGVMLAAAAGILFGVCNVGVKALTGMIGAEGLLLGLLSPWTLVAITGSVAAFYASARSLQDGQAVEVIAITGTAANVSCIAGGIIVFGDPMPHTTLGIVVQALAFILVIVASALTPASTRATGAAPARA
jgi:hypothetical protein